ncbi:hypothetical protein [uncultured Roseobacter sp.]|uniref:hypothetical protein n=1 Tax=uncultured Roseobacter sp. TaxID=114847 RepID=UPI00261A4992|nr:hypothetical protein [uncultured Roseobacter sp.]
MTEPKAEISPKVADLQASLSALDEMPVHERVQVAMLLASCYLEYAAFEMALDQGAEDVSEIIHMAARLDMASRRVSDRAAFAKAAQNLRKM